MFKGGCIQKVDLTPQIDYAQTQKKRCPRCGYEWVYRGEMKCIKCSKCNFSVNSETYTKAYYQTPKYKAYEKARQQRPEYKAYDKARRQTPEHKAYMKAYRKDRCQTPEVKAHRKEYMKAYRQRKKAERLAALAK